MSPELEITGSEKVVETSKELVKDTTAFASRRMIDSWTAPYKLVLVQIFFVHIINLLGNEYKDPTFFEKCLRFPVSKWADM